MRHPPPFLKGSLIAFMVVAWTLNFLVGKIGLRYLEPLTLASFRVVLAGLVMLLVYLVYRLTQTPGAREKNPGPESSASLLRAAPSRYGWADFRTFALLGLFGVAGNQMCFTVGLNYTTVGHSSLIVALGPIVILLLARAQGQEALTARKLLGMGLSFVGVTLLAVEHGFSLRTGTLLGDLITFTGTCALAVYTVLGKKVATKYETMDLNAWSFFAGALLVLPLAARQAVRLSQHGSWGGVDWRGWAALVYMAVVASVVAYLIYLWVLRYLSASRLGAYGYLHPVLTTLLGVAVLGEKLTLVLLLGGTLVLTGVYLTESRPEEDQQEAISLESQ